MCTPLLKAIGKAGSRRKLAKLIGITADSVNAWLNRGINIPLEYAIEIERFMEKEVTWQELAPHLAHFEKRWQNPIQPTFQQLQMQHIYINRINHVDSFIQNEAIKPLLENIQQHGLQKPICTDTENHLIFGTKRLQAYQLLGKKTIPSWRLSLPNLINGKYHTEQLTKTFLTSERVAIGIALEKSLGNRQGKRTDKQQLVQNSAQVASGKKTRELIAEQLGFGSHFTYQAAKKVIAQGAPALTDAIDQQLISISTAALLTKLTQDKQISILNFDSKRITTIANQIRKKEFSAAAISHLHSHGETPNA